MVPRPARGPMSTTAKLQIKDEKVAVLNPPPSLDLDVPTSEHPR